MTATVYAAATWVRRPRIVGCAGAHLLCQRLRFGVRAGGALKDSSMRDGAYAYDVIPDRTRPLVIGGQDPSRRVRGRIVELRLLPVVYQREARQ